MKKRISGIILFLCGITLSVVFASCPITGSGFSLNVKDLYLSEKFEKDVYAIMDYDEIYKAPLTVVIHNGYYGLEEKTIRCSVKLSGVGAKAFQIKKSWNSKEVTIDSEKEAKFEVNPVNGLSAGRYYATVTVTDHNTPEEDTKRWRSFVVWIDVE